MKKIRFFNINQSHEFTVNVHWMRTSKMTVLTKYAQLLGFTFYFLYDINNS
jgi:hypothetical protein